MSETQKFMGRHSLLKRLAAQMGGNEDMAKAVLVKRGQMTHEGKLTPAGQARDRMTAEERAKDRAAKKTGDKPSSFSYNPRTNEATRKRR